MAVSDFLPLADEKLRIKSHPVQATITINNGRVSFHDLYTNFNHSGTKADEIPFFVQFLDRQGHTLMLSGNLEGRRLYHGERFPSNEVIETVFFFGKPSRRLITPVHIHQQHLGWLIVTVPFDYLDDFKEYKNKTLLTTGSIGVLIFVLLKIIKIFLKVTLINWLSASKPSFKYYNIF